MATHRQAQINDQTAKEMAEILRSVKDPRVSGSFISVTGAEVAKDLAVAKIFYSVLGKSEGVEEGLESASGFIRKELASRLNLRATPRLVFINDDSTKRAMDISQIIKDIGVPEE